MVKAYTLLVSFLASRLYIDGHIKVVKEAAEILWLFGSYKEKKQKGQIIEISRSFHNFGLSFVVIRF